MIIHGEFCELETEDYGKGMSMTAYMDWVMGKPEFKEEVARQYENLILYGTTDVRPLTENQLDALQWAKEFMNRYDRKRRLKMGSQEAIPEGQASCRTYTPRRTPRTLVLEI